jgi:hypothetical protein
MDVCDEILTPSGFRETLAAFEAALPPRKEPAE